MPSCTSVTSAGSTPVGQSNDPSIRFSFSGSGQSHREAKLASRRMVSTNCAGVAKKLQCFQSTLCWHEIARWQVLVQRHQFRAFPQSFLHQMVRDITAKLWAGGLRVGNEFLVQSKTANASSLAHHLTSCLCSSAEDRSVVSGEPALMTLLIKFESV